MQHFSTALGLFSKLAFGLTTFVGAVLVVALQLISYVNHNVKAHGTMPTVTPKANALWMFFNPLRRLDFYDSTRGNWNSPLTMEALPLGSLLVILDSLSVAFDPRWRSHGSLGIVLITLTGFFPIAATWRHLMSKGAQHVDE
ncbi:hypothetical protein [Pseudomonas sp. NGC7]|uniref:hypothetical protein n=1 Tax=Pseudomonas sp. NGC7 TaxID=3341775 RepID=UPI00399D476B